MPQAVADPKKHGAHAHAKPHGKLLVAGVVLAAVVAFIVMRRSSSSSTVATGLDPNAIDPNTGLTYGEETAGLGGISGVSTDPGTGSSSADISAQLSPLSQQIDSLSQYAAGLGQIVSDQQYSLESQQQTLGSHQSTLDSQQATLGQQQTELDATVTGLGQEADALKSVAATANDTAAGLATLSSGVASLSSQTAGLSSATNASLQELADAITTITRSPPPVAPASSTTPSPGGGSTQPASTPADVQTLQPLPQLPEIIVDVPSISYVPADLPPSTSYVIDDHNTPTPPTYGITTGPPAGQRATKNSKGQVETIH